MKNLLISFFVGISTMCFSQWNLIYNYYPSVMTSDGTGYSYSGNFLSPSAGYSYTVVKTTNDWQSTSIRFSGKICGITQPNCFLTDMTFLNDTLGFFLTTKQSSFQILNGTFDSFGTSQVYATIVGSNNYIENFHFLRFDLGYMILNSTNTLLKISNTATLSAYTVTPIFARKMHFIDDSTGFLLGVDPNGINRILRTYNSGASFNSPLSTGSLNLNNICFPSSNTGFICCDSGIVYKTTDAGLSWNRIAIPAAGALYAISFINNQIGFIGGANGSVFKTIDGGLSWQAENTGITSKVIKIFFFQNGVAYALTESGGLFKNFQSTSLTALNYGGEDVFIYPNPVNNQFVIYSEQAISNGSVTISNYLGQVLFVQTVNGQKTELNLGGFANGVYFVNLKMPQKSITKKIVKQ